MSHQRSVQFQHVDPSSSKQPKRSEKICRRALSTSGIDQYRNNSMGNASEIRLPVVGHKIQPHQFRERFARSPIQPQRLCRLKGDNVPRLVQTGKSLSMLADDVTDLTTADDKKKNRKSWSSIRSAQSTSAENSFRGDYWAQEGMSIDSPSAHNVGNQLVNRVIRLQNELHRKDLEIARLKENTAILPKLNSNPILDRQKSFDHAALSIVRINELIYQTFFMMSCKELEYITKRINAYSSKNGVELFTETYKILQEPFSFRLMEVNTKCGAVFEKTDLSNDDKDKLYEKFDHFFSEQVNPIAKAVDNFLPVLREATQTARESCKASSAFSQWSRDFAAQLQLRPGWEHMGYKVDDLQQIFRNHGMDKHWLPKALIPLFKVLIYENKNLTEENQRQHEEHQDTVKTLNMKISEANAEITKMKSENLKATTTAQENTEITRLRQKLEAANTANFKLQDMLNERRKSSLARSVTLCTPIAEKTRLSFAANTVPFNAELKHNTRSRPPTPRTFASAGVTRHHYESCPSCSMESSESETDTSVSCGSPTDKRTKKTFDDGQPQIQTIEDDVFVNDADDYTKDKCDEERESMVPEPVCEPKHLFGQLKMTNNEEAAQMAHSAFLIHGMTLETTGNFSKAVVGGIVAAVADHFNSDSTVQPSSGPKKPERINMNEVDHDDVFEESCCLRRIPRHIIQLYESVTESGGNEKQVSRIMKEENKIEDRDAIEDQVARITAGLTTAILLNNDDVVNNTERIMEEERQESNDETGNYYAEDYMKNGYQLEDRDSGRMLIEYYDIDDKEHSIVQDRCMQGHHVDGQEGQCHGRINDIAENNNTNENEDHGQDNQEQEEQDERPLQGSGDNGDDEKDNDDRRNNNSAHDEDNASEGNETVSDQESQTTVARQASQFVDDEIEPDEWKELHEVLRQASSEESPRLRRRRASEPVEFEEDADHARPRSNLTMCTKRADSAEVLMEGETGYSAQGSKKGSVADSDVVGESTSVDVRDDAEDKPGFYEFWELARVLSKALSVELPQPEDADFTAIDADEGMYLERYRRELAADVILDKVKALVAQLKRHESLISRQTSVRSAKSIEGSEDRCIRNVNRVDMDAEVSWVKVGGLDNRRNPLEVGKHTSLDDPFSRGPSNAHVLRQTCLDAQRMNQQ